MRNAAKLGVMGLLLLAVASVPLYAADEPAASIHLRIAPSNSAKTHSVPAVAWLVPEPGTPASPFNQHGPYTLLQKNRMFIPHLQVIPVGAAVQFPNEDPYFHNVFSMYAGKRFDLGLYEAGATKSVAFSREGVSYIFCNIHPEMSAVVVALSTSLYGIANAENAVSIRNIPPGDYTLHIWVEGVPESILQSETRRVHLPARNVDLGTITLPLASGAGTDHSNKFGKPYTPLPKQPY